MNKYKRYEHPTHEPDEKEREKMTFNKPFSTNVLEGGSNQPPHKDVEKIAILSSN